MSQHPVINTLLELGKKDDDSVWTNEAETELTVSCPTSSFEFEIDLTTNTLTDANKFMLKAWAMEFLSANIFHLAVSEGSLVVGVTDWHVSGQVEYEGEPLHFQSPDQLTALMRMVKAWMGYDV